MAPSVLIIGAGGTVGRPLVQEFLKNKTRFGRIAVLSDPAKIERFADVQRAGIEVVVGSFLEASSYRGFDTVISLAGNATMKLQPGMIDAAIAGGARHFYPSEFGGDIGYGALGKMRYFRDKVVTREHLRQRAREFPEFAYTLLIIGGFTEFIASAFNGVDVENHTASLYGSADARLTVTAMPDTMHYIVESVLLPLEAGQTCRELRVAGETLTCAAFLDILGEVQGVKYATTYLDPAEAAVKEEAARVAGDVDAELLWAGKALLTVAFVPGPYDNARFAFTPETVRETLRRLFGTH
ncbi:hypothetical protein C8J57DRAFT_1193357 [Mycena rebaudengoi]|nr:hypothetical protein C8J57DRAFT_1193357 [Mycena rebaudengoi]